MRHRCWLAFGGFIIAFVLGLSLVLPIFDKKTGVEALQTYLDSILNKNTENLGDKPPSWNWTIDGDLVYVNNSKAYLSAYPHTLGSSGWVEFELESKSYGGSIDYAFGFNTTTAKPKRMEIWRNYSHQMIGWIWSENSHNNLTITNITSGINLGIVNYDNYTYVVGNRNNSKLWMINYTNYDMPGEFNETLVIAFLDATGTGSNRTFHYLNDGNTSYLYNLSFYDWKPFSKTPEITHKDILNSTTQYYFKNLTIQQNKRYKVRIWVELPFGGLEGLPKSKYWWALKPNSETIQEAIDNNHLVLLDPWWGGDGTAYGYMKNLYIGNKIDDYQMKLIVDYDINVGGNVSCEGHCQTDFGDIRFVHDNTSVIPYWLENYTSGEQATFWINNSYNDTCIQIYYGTSGASSTTSNGTTVFIFFDDFEDALQGDWITVTGSPDYANSGQAYNSTQSMLLTRAIGNEGVRYDIPAPTNSFACRMFWRRDTGDDVNCFIPSHNTLDYTCYWAISNTDDIQYYDGAWQDTGYDAPDDVWFSLGTSGHDTTAEQYDIYFNDALIINDADTWDGYSPWVDCVYIVANAANEYVYVDNFMIMYWSSPEPYWSSFGSEESAAAWQSIEEWNLTIYNQTGFVQIENWNLTLWNQSNYDNIESWNLTIYNQTVGFSQIEEWNTTLYNQSGYILIENWNLTIYNQSGFASIEEWNLTIWNSSVGYQQINIWNLTIYNQSSYRNIEEWNLTIYNQTVGYILVEEWNITLWNQTLYVSIETWNLTLYNQSGYSLVENWNLTIHNVSVGYQQIETWNLTLWNQSGYSNIETWNLTLWNQSSYSSIETWNLTIWNLSIGYSTIEEWNLTIYNQSNYWSIEEWNLTIYNTSIAFTSVETWNLTIYNQSSYQNIDEWNLTIYNTSIGYTQIKEWNLTIWNQTVGYITIDEWNITIYNQSGYILINEWNLTIYNISVGYQQIEIWNLTIWNQSQHQVIEEWNLTIYNQTVGYQQVEEWNLTLWNQSIYYSIDEWNLTIYNTSVGYTQVEQWNLTIYNVSVGYQQVETWNLTIWNQTIGYQQVEEWNLTLWNQSNYQSIEEWNLTLYNVSVGFTQVEEWNLTIWNTSVGYQQINIWNLTIYNSTPYSLVEEWNLTIYNITLYIITITDEYPSNGSTDIPINTVLHIDLDHTDGYIMNITWYGGNTSNCTHYLGSHNNINNGIYHMGYSNTTEYNTLYYWRVNISDGEGNHAEEIYHFTTGGSGAGAVIIPIGQDGMFNMSMVLVFGCLFLFMGVFFGFIFKRRRNKKDRL